MTEDFNRIERGPGSMKSFLAESSSSPEAPEAAYDAFLASEKAQDWPSFRAGWFAGRKELLR